MMMGMSGMLDKTTIVNLLYDFYRPLLNEKQRSFMELYYGEDWSLGEIAEHYAISRQAVHDLLKRVEKALDRFEQDLHLLEKHRNRQQIIRQMEQKLADHPELWGTLEPLLNQLSEVD